jgi:hypothetical protein
MKLIVPIHAAVSLALAAVVPTYITAHSNEALQAARTASMEETDNLSKHRPHMLGL